MYFHNAIYSAFEFGHFQFLVAQKIFYISTTEKSTNLTWVCIEMGKGRNGNMELNRRRMILCEIYKDISLRQLLTKREMTQRNSIEKNGL